MAVPKHVVAVGAFVKNDKDEILMILSPLRGWEFPGGQVERGESIIQALIREVFEETGINIIPRKIVGIYSNTNPQNNKYNDSCSILNLDFICKYIDGYPKCSPESLEVKWIKIKQALDLVTSSMVKIRLQHMINFKKDIIYKEYGGNPLEIYDEKIIS